ncbi:MAG TPA: M20/M25/M40 family metallo-hydrolase [Nitrososphaeraceae archaeon]|nr:M20/M25/M40 family metallo-hydrolase [Nitrososphaeraceae archaeon]
MNIKPFKNVIAVLDNEFGYLRIIKNDRNNLFVNDIDLSYSTNDLLDNLEKNNCKLFLLIREKYDHDLYEQLTDFLPSFTRVIPFVDHLDILLSKLKTDFLLNSEETIFISSDRSSRQIASINGFYALPHVKIASMAIGKKSFEFVQIVGNRLAIDQIPKEDILPYHIKEMNDGTCELVAIISNKGRNKAIYLKLQVLSLEVDISNEDIVLVNLDDTINEYKIEKALSAYGFLFSGNHFMYLTVGNNKIANIPIHGSHGHFIQLIPDETLLSKINGISEFKSRPAESGLSTILGIINKWPSKYQKLKSSNLAVSSFIEASLDDVDPNYILDNIKRYSGVIDLDSTGKIKSRHCLHPDNKRSIEALKQDLEQMGYFVNVWEFQADERPPGKIPTPENPDPKSLPNTEVEGATFYNVIAELSGRGDNLLLENDLSSKIRDIFIKYPNPLRNQLWISEIRDLTGEEWFKENNFESLSPLDLKRTLEKVFGLTTWSNWWIKDKEISGLGSEIIIVGCHLDSTANLIFSNERGTIIENDHYKPNLDDAPGADDDGSGLSATLGLARLFSKFRDKLKYTIQFCFFNGEEVGMRGSMKYARYMKESHAPIKAVICIDMIGYNKDNTNRTFEIHAGFYNESIRDMCLPLADMVEEEAKNLGKLGTAQIYGINLG